MSNKTMYAIMASGGDYDDSWTNAEYITDDLVKGQAYVDKMNTLSTQVKDAHAELQRWDAEYKKANPQPDIPNNTDVVEVPRWDGSKPITAEMRAERLQLEQLNAAARAEALRPYRKWSEIWWEAHTQYCESFRQEIQDGMDRQYDTIVWSIEEIKWLPQEEL